MLPTFGRAALGVSVLVVTSCSDTGVVTPVPLGAPEFAVQSTLPAVRISEIHYDNTSTDAGEAVEISGPRGTDLTGWSIVLYNGSGGAAYDTDALSGTIPATCDTRGVVVLTYPVNGIQNGSPDGLALVNGGTVVEFLSYEGTFTAVGGPANGLVSIDIGATEAGSEPLGQSLQRDGAGNWSGPIANTFGACNDDDEPVPPPPPPPLPDTRFSELHYDNDGVDIAEAIEIEGPTGVDLAGWSVVLYNGSGGAAYDTRTLSGTIGDRCAGRGVVRLTYPSNGIQNGSPDGLALVNAAGTVIEFLSYEGTFTAADGPAAGVLSTDLGVSEATSTPLGRSLQRSSSGDVASAPGRDVRRVQRGRPRTTAAPDHDDHFQRPSGERPAPPRRVPGPAVRHAGGRHALRGPDDVYLDVGRTGGGRRSGRRVYGAHRRHRGAAGHGGRRHDCHDVAPHAGRHGE